MRLSSKNYTNVFLTCLLSVNLFLFNSCSNSSVANSNTENQSTNAENTSVPSDDIAKLAALVRLPEIPEEVVWREEVLGNSKTGVPGPTERKLTAVLKYSAESAAKIVALVEKNKPVQQAEIGAESWFPEELIAQSQLSGNESLKGSSYGANDFYNTPYANGKLVRIEKTDYFVLELVTF